MQQCGDIADCASAVSLFLFLGYDSKGSWCVSLAPGWVTLEVPPLEAWQERLLWLEHPQRERIESPEFYRLLQEQIGRRYLAASTR